MLWSSTLGFKRELKIRNTQSEGCLCAGLCSPVTAAAPGLQLPSKPVRDGIFARAKEGGAFLSIFF